MTSPESDSTVAPEDEEDIALYQFIYDMDTNVTNEEEKETVQIPSSFGPTPVHLETNAEGDGSEDKTTHNTTQVQRQEDKEVTNTKRLENVHRSPVLKVNRRSKPWERAGADITDYFNYGFDEKSWNTYRKKQQKLRTSNRKLNAYILAQEGHTKHEENKPSSAHRSSGYPSILESRESNASIDVMREQPGPSNREEWHQCQVVTEMSSEEDSPTSSDLPLPYNSNSLFEFTPPPPFLFRRGPASPSSSLDCGHSKGLDGPSATLGPHSSGVSSLIPRSMTSKAGVIDTARAWECYIWQGKLEKGRDRSREHNHDKDSKGGRDKDRESCPSSYSSEEEHLRHRDSKERGHRRHSFDRSSGVKEERYSGKKHTEKSEGWKKSSCSSSSSSSSSRRSRRDTNEDRDSQSRHKHKKGKRHRKDKQTTEIVSADQERKFKSD